MQKLIQKGDQYYANKNIINHYGFGNCPCVVYRMLFRLI